MADRDGVRWAACYGHADPAAGRPVTADTLFEIGSVSKSFTAFCLLREVERGRLSVHDEVRSLLPWFPFGGITVHHLLSHTGGIVCMLGDPPSPAYEILALADTARVPPGGRFWYSNVGYQTLGYVLEQVTGEPFAEAYRRELLEPLGLRHTEPHTTTAIRPRLAVGHEPLDDTRPWRLGDPLAPATWVEYRGADGGICAAVSDLASYGGLYLRGEAPAAMTEPVVEDEEDGCWYGYGVMLREVAGRRWVGHSGSTVGFRTQLWADLDAGLAVVAFVNGQTGSKLLVEHALRLAAGDDVADPALEGLDEPAAAVALDPEPAQEWRPICGLYRSHNPWAPVIRVTTAEGRPVAVVWGDCHALVPLADGSFRLGEQAWSPERLRFDALLEGRFMRVRHGATAFHRPT